MLHRILVLLLVALLGSQAHGARIGNENSSVMKDAALVGTTGSLEKQHQLGLGRRKDFGSSFLDDDMPNGKRLGNGGSHFRLFYKSNTPERSISHQLEHRYFKRPNGNYYSSAANAADSNQYNLNPSQYNSAPAYNNHFMWPGKANTISYKPKSYSQHLANKNRQTMLNIHYHGQNIQDIDGSFI